MTTNLADDERPEDLSALSHEGSAQQLEPDGSEVTVAEQLQGLVIDSADVDEFLVELCEYSSELASVDGEAALDCAVTLYRRRRALTGTGNSARARMLNKIQERMGEGPCLTALQEERTVIIHETVTDKRWPEYSQELLAQGIHSVLAVPLILDEGASASINFFSPRPEAFNEGIVGSAERYAGQAQMALRLAVRIGVKQQTAEDLQEAMKARTTIDLAVGVIMGQQRCSQDAAFQILSRAASSRNQKVRTVAQELLAHLSSSTIATHFDG